MCFVPLLSIHRILEQRLVWHRALATMGFQDSKLELQQAVAPLQSPMGHIDPLRFPITTHGLALVIREVLLSKALGAGRCGGGVAHVWLMCLMFVLSSSCSSSSQGYAGVGAKCAA